MKNNKVVHISNNDTSGGAAKAAYRLHEAMLQSGIQSTLLVLFKHSKGPHVVSFYSFWVRLKVALYWRIERLMLRKYNVKGTFSLAKFGFNMASYSQLNEADVIIMHWINGYMMSVYDIGRILALGKPTYYFMHDMWPFTGGCHHSFDCQSYTNACGNCPLLSSHSKHDHTYRVLSMKLKCWHYANLMGITPSKWLGNCAQSSHLFRDRFVKIIPNLIDTNVFKPVEQTLARQSMNLPLNKKLILFSAASVSDYYKGWSFLVDSLSCINKKDVELVVMGSSYDVQIANVLSMPIHFLGYVSSEQIMINVYSAVDVFVIPSIAENFPNSIVESFACGTPAVGFNIGGIPELIIHQQTGYLAQSCSSSDLAAGIDWVLAQPRELLSKNVLKLVEETLSYSKVAEYYGDILQ